MSTQQQLITGTIAVIAVLLIIFGTTRNTESPTTNDQTEESEMEATSSISVSNPASAIVATRNVSERRLRDQSGKTFVSPLAEPDDTITFDSISVNEKVGARTDILRVAYQHSSKENSYAYLGLYRVEGGNEVQKSRLFLGENVKITSLTTSKNVNTATGEYRVNVSFLDQKPTDSPTANPTWSRTLGVVVKNGTFDFDSAQFIN